MTPRRPLQIAAAMAAAGLALAVALAFEHARAHAGLEGFCTLNDFVNCDRVATSSFSVVLGVPLAVWGAFSYAAALALALAGLRSARPHGSWPAGLLVLLGGLMTAAAVVLAAISELGIGALCLLCAASWLTSAALLVAAWRATRPLGPLAAIRADLRHLRASPGRTAGLVVAGLAAAAIAVAVYPRYWEKPPEARRPAQARTPQPVPAATGGGPVVVVSFSDYECPYCALAHEELKAVLAARPDVKVVKKHFPLDPACNSAVQRAVHPGACVLAAAAVCAEEQGKLGPMDDALFRNQKAKRPVEALAREAGLDLPRFQECLRTPATLRRVQADVANGIAIGVRATPTYVVNGVTLPGGKLTLQDLPPAPAAQAAPAPR